MQSTIGQRIRKRRKDLKFTQQYLAKKMTGVSHVAISQWESDTTKPNAENLYELSLLLGCDIAWLLKGEGENVRATTLPDYDSIPVVEERDLLDWNMSAPIILKQGAFVLTNTPNSKMTFAFRLSGDSMKPDFSEGDIVIIDPLVKPSAGEFVIAKVNDQIYFRKYKLGFMGDTGEEQFMLSPLNDDYATYFSNNHEIILIGTMIEHRIYRRKR